MSNPKFKIFHHNGQDLILLPGIKFTANELRSRLHQMEINFDPSIRVKSILANIYDTGIQDDDNKIKILDKICYDTEYYTHANSSIDEKAREAMKSRLKSTVIQDSNLQRNFQGNYVSNQGAQNIMQQRINVPNDKIAITNYNELRDPVFDNQKASIQQKSYYNQINQENIYRTNEDPFNRQSNQAQILNNIQKIQGNNQSANYQYPNTSQGSKVINNYQGGDDAVNLNYKNYNQNSGINNKYNSRTSDSIFNSFVSPQVDTQSIKNNLNNNENIKYYSGDNTAINYGNSSNISKPSISNIVIPKKYNFVNPKYQSNLNVIAEDVKENVELYPSNNNSYINNNTIANDNSKISHRSANSKANNNQNILNIQDNSYNNINTNRNNNNNNYISSYDNQNSINENIGNNFNNNQNINTSTANNEINYPQFGNINLPSYNYDRNVGNLDMNNSYEYPKSHQNNILPADLNKGRNYKSQGGDIQGNRNRYVRQNDIFPDSQEKDIDNDDSNTPKKENKLIQFYNDNKNEIGLGAFSLLGLGFFAFSVYFIITHNQTIINGIKTAASGVKSGSTNLVELIWNLIKGLFCGIFVNNLFYTIPAVIIGLIIYYIKWNKDFQQRVSDMYEALKLELKNRLENSDPDDLNAKVGMTKNEIINFLSERFKLRKEELLKVYWNALSIFRRTHPIIKINKRYNESIGQHEDVWEYKE